jgi:sulfur-carrier protein
MRGDGCTLCPAVVGFRIPMRIKVKLFAVLRERAGVGEVIIELPMGATVADVVEHVALQFPAIANFLPRVGHAVNLEYVTATTMLHDGDELALIPPVSGG